MDQVYLFLGICLAAMVVFFVYKATAGKKKRLAKPQEVQQRVEYDKRYPKRSKILKKEYHLEDTDDPTTKE